MGSSKFYEVERQLIYSFNKNNIDSKINNKNYVHMYIFINNLFFIFFKDLYRLKYIKNSLFFKFNTFVDYRKISKYRKKNIIRYLLGNVWYLKYNNFLIIIFFYFHSFNLKSYIKRKIRKLKINFKSPYYLRLNHKFINKNYKFEF